MRFLEALGLAPPAANPYREFLLARPSLGALDAGHMANRRDAKGTHAEYLKRGLLADRALAAWLMIAAKSAGASLDLGERCA